LKPVIQEIVWLIASTMLATNPMETTYVLLAAEDFFGRPVNVFFAKGANRITYLSILKYK